MRSFYEMIRLMEQVPQQSNQATPNPQAQQTQTSTQQNNSQGAVQQQNKVTNQSQAGLIDIKAGPGEVLKAAQSLVSDPQKRQILLAGLNDGNPKDELISISPGSRKASDLRPTQSEIGTQESLDDQIMDKYGGTMLNAGISGGRVPSKDGQFPILTFGNKILDGHHRWSQVFATNPNATLETAEISAAGVTDEKAALGLVHAILLALYGKSPTKPFKGQNVFNMDRNAVKEYVKNNIVDSALQKLNQAGLIQSPDREQAAEMYANNIEALKANGQGAFPRTVMPQPLDAGDASALTTAPPDAAAGKVNYIDPKPQDVGANANQLQAAHTRHEGPSLNEWLVLSGIKRD